MERLQRSDLVWALALVVGCAIAYGATQQARIYGDGAPMLQLVAHAPDGGANWIHALHVPLTRALVDLSGSTAPWKTMLWVSSGPGAVMVAAVFLLARRFGAAAVDAALVALLLAATPAVWFFSTTVELHALHGAVVAIAALTSALLPWRRLRVDAWISGSATLLVFSSHQSGVLLHAGLVFVAWAFVRDAASRRGAPAPKPRAFVELTAIHAVCALAGVLLGRAWAGDMGSVHQGGLIAFLRDSRVPFDLEVFVDTWFTPLALLWFVIAATFVESSARRRLGWAVLGTIAPVFVFFTILGVSERGAYAFGFLPIATAAGAAAVSNLGRNVNVRRAVLGVAMALQGWLAHSALVAFDEPMWRERLERRGAHVSALGPGSIQVLAFDPRFQVIETTHPQIREIDMLGPLRGQIAVGVSTEELAAKLEQIVGMLILVPDVTVVLDRGYVADLPRAPELQPVFAALEERVLAAFDVASHPDGDHDYWVLRSRRSE